MSRGLCGTRGGGAGYFFQPSGGGQGGFHPAD